VGERVSGLAPWRQVVAWPRAGQSERVVDITPGPQVRRELAQRLDLEGLSSLHAHLTLTPWLDGVEITGVVDAVAERICGISLEAYLEPLQERVALRMLPPASPHLQRDDGNEVIVDLDAPDPPEAGDVEGVDLAQIVAEAVALALPPFARKPQAAWSLRMFAPPATVRFVSGMNASSSMVSSSTGSNTAGVSEVWIGSRSNAASIGEGRWWLSSVCVA